MWPKPQRRIKRIKNKYGARKVQFAGRSFDSGLERDLFLYLLDEQNHHRISDIKQQVPVYLTDARILYRPDYSCVDASGALQFHEAKGFETAVWRIKRRLWMHYGPGILHVWARQGKSGLVLKEVVTSKT